MTDVTTLLAGIKTRTSEATSLGEWETTRANDVVVYAPNGFGAYHLIAHADAKEDAAFIAAARTDVPRLVAAIEAVAKVHEPVDALMNPGRHERVVKVCTGCGTDDGNWQRWPCPTITAVVAALGGGE